MTLQELLERVPEQLRPAVTKYGPALLTMTAQELWDWIELCLAGNTAEAIRTVYRRMPESELVGAMQKNLDGWNAANAANAARVALQREAALAVLKAALTAALALVGL